MAANMITPASHIQASLYKENDSLFFFRTDFYFPVR